jgi:hypothetical protein
VPAEACYGSSVPTGTACPGSEDAAELRTQERTLARRSKPIGIGNSDRMPSGVPEERDRPDTQP